MFSFRVDVSALLIILHKHMTLFLAFIIWSIITQGEETFLGGPWKSSEREWRRKKESLWICVCVSERDCLNRTVIQALKEKVEVYCGLYPLGSESVSPSVIVYCHPLMNKYFWKTYICQKLFQKFGKQKWRRQCPCSHGSPVLMGKKLGCFFVCLLEARTARHRMRKGGLF